MRNNLRKIGCVILLVVLVSTLAIPSFSINRIPTWSGTPQCNAVDVYVGNQQIIKANHSIESITGEFVPATLLCDEMVYLSVEAWAACGAGMYLDDEYSMVISSVDFNRLGKPIQVQDMKQASIDKYLIESGLDITVGSELYVYAGDTILYNWETYPSSIFVDTLYFPAQPIFQELGIDVYWDQDTSTLFLGTNKLVDTSVPPVGLINFKKVNTYREGQFIDVANTAWYSQKVRLAYEYGLMTGSGEFIFNPDGDVSIAEAITIACQLFRTYYGHTNKLGPGFPWYQPYVDYARKNGIFTLETSNYERPITRSELAVLVSNAIPDVSLTEINQIENGAIPDVDMNDSAAPAIYCLYRAGILSGSDAKGSFKPNSNITRAEISVILSNLVDTALRTKFTLKNEPQVPVDELSEFYAFYKLYEPQFRTILLSMGNDVSEYLSHHNTLSDLVAKLDRYQASITYSGNNSYILRYLEAVSKIRDGAWTRMQGGIYQDEEAWKQGILKIKTGTSEISSLLQVLIDAGYDT